MPFNLNHFVRNHFWVVPLPLVAIAALLNAQAVSQLLGESIALDAKQLAAPPIATQAAATASSTGVKSADPILARNAFDHVTGSLITTPIAVGAVDTNTNTAPTDDPLSAPTCDGIDVEAIAESDDDDWSFASIAGTDHKTHLRRRGGEVSGKHVHFIGPDRVWLTSTDGMLCQAILFDKKAAPEPPHVVAAPTASSRNGAKPLDPDLKKGIQAVSATEFNIDRGVVDKILENQADLMRQARIVPEQENGRVVGIRLLGVKSDSLLGVLGLQNGDRLQTINGFEMGNPEKALEAYARLRTADKLTISINRGGKNMNLDYNIK